MAAETLEIQLQLKLDQLGQALTKIEQSFGGVGDKAGKKISSDLGNSVDGKKAGDKIGRDLNESIAALKIKKLSGLEIDPSNLGQIKTNINTALSSGKITNQQAASMFSALHTVGKETGSKIGRDLTATAGDSGTGFGKLFGANLVASLASSGIQTAIGGVFSGAMSGFKLGADFEKQLSSIKALTGSTAEEMKKIEGVALKAGKETAFSALEAAQGLEELLKAGLNAEQAQVGLKGALDLAAAGGIGVADAAEIASTALNAFKADGLSVAGAADILAGAANASATSVGELKYGLSSVSAVASGVGMSFSDTNTALALFASNGLKGSDAGTSLKTMLMNLQPKSVEQVALFQELGLESLNAAKGYEFLQNAGINTTQSIDDLGSGFQTLAKKMLGAKASATDIEKQARKLELQSGFSRSAFFNEAGSLRSLSEVSGELKTAFAGMTDAQRLAAMETMFGSDAIRAANILFKEGSNGVNNMAQAMTNFTAADVAAEKLNNFAGKLESLKGTIETALIQTFAGVIPKLTPLLDQLNNSFNTINFEQLGATIGTVLVGAIDLLSGTISFVTNNFTLLSSILAGFGAGGLVASAITTFTAISAALTAAGGAAGIFGAITAVAFAPVTIAVVAIGAAVALFAYAWQNNLGDIQGITKTVLSTVSNVWNSTWSAISSFFTATWATISGAFNSAVDTISGIWTGFTNGLSTVWNAIWETIKSFVAAAFLAIVAYIDGDTLKVNSIMAAFGEKLKSIWGGIWESVKTALANAWTALAAKFEEIKTGVGEAIKAAGESINNTWKSAWEEMGKIDVGAVAMNVINGFVNGIKNGASNVMKAMKDMATNALNAARNTLDEHSPSREMMKIGVFASEGMAIGIDKSGKDVVKSTIAMANSVINSATSGLGTASFGFNPLLQPATTPVLGQPLATANQPIPPAQTPPTTPPVDLMATANEGIDKQNSGLDGMISKISEQLPEAYNLATDKIKEALTNMEAVVIEMATAINENFIGIFSGIGGNIPLGILNGMSQKERQAYEAVANLEDNILRAVGAEIKSRDEFGEAGRGAANNVPSVVSSIGEFARNFQPSGGGGNTQNNKSVNFGQVNIGGGNGMGLVNDMARAVLG